MYSLSDSARLILLDILVRLATEQPERYPETAKLISPQAVEPA